MLSRTGDVHGHVTRAARTGMFMSTRDHRSVGYRVPREWAGLSEAQRGMGSLVAFKGASQAGFLAGYGAFVCGVCGGAVGGCG